MHIVHSIAVTTAENMKRCIRGEGERRELFLAVGKSGSAHRARGVGPSRLAGGGREERAPSSYPPVLRDFPLTTSGHW